MREQTPTPGWWIADDFFKNGGRALVGPFSTRDDALTARSVIEPLSNRMDLFIDEYTKPAVDLPTEPALGWVDWECLRVTGRDLGVYFDRGATLHAASPGDFHHEYVKGFTPAVAVPADALERLREPTAGGLAAWEWDLLVVAFLVAVDEANGSEPR